MARRGIRTFNKLILNRLIRSFAGVSRTPFAVICHVGRRSGKLYETPVIVEPLGDGVVIALTYGPEVDWYRNVESAAGAELRWQGRSYKLGRPEPLAAETALAAFSTPFRQLLRRFGTREFVWMRATPAT